MIKTIEFDKLPTEELLDSASKYLEDKYGIGFTLITILPHPREKELHYTAYFSKSIC